MTRDAKSPPLERSGLPKPGPVFLERTGYRQRRLVDAIRLLPVLGAALWAVPLLWRSGQTVGSVALLYVFGAWVLLVILAALLSRALGRSGWGAIGPGGADDDDGRPPAAAAPAVAPDAERG